MDKEIKEMYYLSRYNMNKYLKTCDGYYQIVGFTYYILNDGFHVSKGLIVIKDNEKLCTYDNVCKNWRGINKIFLNKNEGQKHHYVYDPYPLRTGHTIVNEKGE